MPGTRPNKPPLPAKEVPMKMRTIGICTLVLVLTTGGALSATAAPPAGGHAEARPMRTFLSGQFGRLLALRADLQLTDEQRDQIHQIVQSHKQEIATVMKPVVEKRRALRAATSADEPNDQAIRTAANELGQALGDAAVVGAKIKVEVRHVLTPEQQEKLGSYRKQADGAVDQFIQQAANPS
jgi:Spy/CpxP family protein refolding chaperone